MVGRNGYGKTTMLQLITGQVEPDSGEISIPDGYKIGYLEQLISFSRSSVLEEACMGLPEEEANDQWKAEKILCGLGFTRDDFKEDPLSFSSGFQVRLNLAKIILSNPDLLLLDEPNNYLDIVSTRWLAGFLRSCRKELILITHDRGFMDSITTHTMIIHRHGIRKFSGGTAKAFSQIAKEEETHEKTRLNFEVKRQQTEEYIRRFRAKARLASSVQSRVKALEKQAKLVKLDKIKSLDFSFNAESFNAAQMMTVNDISFSYGEDEPELIKDLYIEINNKDRICVIGKNGKGKSTLLKVLDGKLEPGSGAIKTHPKLRIGYYAETEKSCLNDHKSVLEEVMGISGSQSAQHVRNICGTLMFCGDDALKKIDVLSGGEKSRVLLGKLLINPCNMLLLDEPTNHLDMESCAAMLEAVDEFSGAVVMVTHNEDFLHRIAQRLIVFNNDSVKFFNGTYQEFLDKIGWADEKESLADKENTDKKTDKKALKKMKAELRQERFKVLDPMEKQIKDYEKRITEQEKELKTNTELMVKASMESEASSIAELSKKEPLLKANINELYSKLEKLALGYEEQCDFFEKSLKELEERK
ncbi:ATP-binding cassette domain-containing protein [Elusimicrobiota bacterium]